MQINNVKIFFMIIFHIKWHLKILAWPSIVTKCVKKFDFGISLAILEFALISVKLSETFKSAETLPKMAGSLYQRLRLPKNFLKLPDASNYY